MSSNCQAWLKTCLEGLKQGILNALKYATNLKSLVIIRDAVLEFESKLKVANISNTSKSWDGQCEFLFKQKVEIWSELVAPFYFLQSKVSQIYLLMRLFTRLFNSFYI